MKTRFSTAGITLASLLSLLLIFLSGCGNKKTPVEQGIEEQVLHIGNLTEPADLDPQIVAGLQEYKILMALFEGLVNMDPKTLKPIPGVAESWNISDNGKKYTFKLRKNARWSNGDPVTADDFLFSYKRMLSRKLGTPYAYFFYHVVNAEDFHKGKIKDFSRVGINSLDKGTLEIKLKEPVPYFLSLLTHMAWYPVHKDTLLKYGAIDERGTNWTRGGNLVSNGPFVLKSWVISKSIVVEKNPEYWDNDKVQLNAIHFYPIDNPNTEERAFRTGQLHITGTLPLPKIKNYRKNNSPYLRLNPFFSTYAYVFNTAIEPFNDVRVRKALSLSIDRKSITDNVTQKSELPAFTYVPPGVPGYKTSAKLTENITEAQKLLAEAGYPNGEGFPRATLVYNTSDSHRAVAEALQHMWAKNLNIHVDLINQEWKVYLRTRVDGQFNLLRFGWVGDYLDPNAFLEVFSSKSGNNFSRWRNAKYDELLEKAANTLDEKKRFGYFDQAEAILLDQLPVLPIYFWNLAYLIHPSVKNWYSNLLDLHPYQYIYLEGSN